MRELSVLGVPSWDGTVTKDKQMQNATYLFIDSISFLSSNDASNKFSVCDRFMGNLNTVSLPTVSSVTFIWHSIYFIRKDAGIQITNNKVKMIRRDRVI